MMAVKWFLLILSISANIATSAENALTSNAEILPNRHLQNGKQILVNMAQAMRGLNYQGTVAFLRGGMLEPMKYSHATKKGLEQEHLLSLNSPLREVIRESDKVSCLYKSTSQLVIDYRPFEHSFLIDMPDDINQLDKAYEIEILGEENIAMVPAYVVSIKPKDKLRYSRKLWIGQRQSLPLKLVVYDLAGEVLQEWVFTDIEVKDTLPFIEMDTQSKVPPTGNNSAFESSAQADFVITTIPNGFKEVFFSRKPMRNAENPVDHLLLSDGLAAVSVYMEHKNNALPSINSDTRGIQSVNAVNFYSHTLGDFQLTVMGEVPSETIRLIAENIKLREH